MSAFTLRSAVTAAGNKTNEDAYGVWPHEAAPRAAWVLDGVTGINDRLLLPGPTDAAWFVAQTQEALPSLLATLSTRPAAELIGRLADDLAARQDAAWLSPDGAGAHETPAASFALFRQLGDEVEIARLGDCPVLLERNDGCIVRLDDPVLSAIEADIKTQVVALREQSIADPPAVLREMMPALRAIRRRRNAPGGYGVLTADRVCLDFLQVDRFAARDLRSVLLVSDGYYRLVNIYGAMSEAELMRRTAKDGADAALNELRAIEAADTTGARYPRLKMADDATALLLGKR